MITVLIVYAIAGGIVTLVTIGLIVRWVRRARKPLRSIWPKEPS